MQRLNLHIAFTDESAYKDYIGLPAEELAPRQSRFADDPPSISIQRQVSIFEPYSLHLS